MTKRLRAFLAGAAMALASGSALVVAAGAVLVGFLFTPWGEAFVGRRVEAVVDGALSGGDLGLGGVTLGLDGTIELEDVHLVGGDGVEHLGARRVIVALDVPTLLRERTIHARSVHAHGLRVDVGFDDAGVLDLMRVFGQTEPSPPSSEPWAGLPIGVRVDRVALVAAHVVYRDAGEVVADLVVDGTAAVAGEGRFVAVDQVDLLVHADAPVGLTGRLRGGVDYTGDSVVLHDLAVQLPGTRLTLRGAVAGLESTVDLQIDADVAALDLLTIDPIAGRPGLRGVYGGTLGAHGRLDALALTGTLEGRSRARGTLAVLSTVDLTSDPFSWRADLDLSRVSVDDAYAGVGGDVLLDGRLEVHGAGTSWPDDLTIEGTFAGKAQTFYGLELDGLDLAVSLVNGDLQIQDASLQGLVGAVHTQGGLDLRNGKLDQEVTGTLDLRRLVAFDVPGLRGHGPVNLTVTGDVFAVGTPIEARGRVRLRDFGWEEDVSFDTLEADLTVRVQNGVTEVRADLRGTDGLVYGTTVATARLPDLDVTVDDGGTSIRSGAASIGGFVYPDLATVGAATGAITVRVPSVGDPAVATALSLESVDLRGHHAQTGRLDVGLVGDDLSVTVDLDAPPGRQDPLVALTLGLDTASSDVEVSRLVVSPQDGTVLRAEGPVRLRLVEGGAEQVAARLGGTFGVVDVQAGRIASTGGLDVRFGVQGLDLAALRAFAPEAEGWSGRVDAQGELGGTVDDPRGLATIGLAALARRVPPDPTVEGSVARIDGPFDLDATVGFESGAVRIAGRAGSEGPLVDVHGTVPVRFGADAGLDPHGTVDLRVVVLPGGFDRFARLAQGVTLPSGSLSAVVDVSGSVRDPQVAVRGVAEVAVPGWEQPARVELDVVKDGRSWRYWADLRQGMTEHGAIVGEAHNRLDLVAGWALGEGQEPDWSDFGLFFDDLDLSIAAIGLPVRSVLVLVDPSLPFGGELVGGARISGPWHAPVVEGAFDWIADPEARGPAALVQGGFVAVAPEDGGYRVNGEVLFVDGGAVTVGGSIPVRVDLRDGERPYALGDLDLTFSGALIPLALAKAFDSGITEAEGSISLEGTAKGPADRLFPAFTLQMEGGSLTYAPTAVRYEDIRVALHADASAVTLEEVSLRTVPTSDRVAQLVRGSTEGANVSLTGTIGLDLGSPASANLALNLRDAWVSAADEERFRVSGDVVANGPWSGLKVRTAGGALQLQSGLLFLDAAAFLSASPLVLDPSLVVHRGNTPAAALAEAEQVTTYGDLDVDVAIDLVRNLDLQVSMPYIDDLGALGAAVTRADLSARLGGEVRIRTDPEAGLTLNGEVEVLEGQVRVMQSQFDLSEGTISFPSGDYANPEMSLAGEMQVTGGSVEIAIEGTAEQPELELTSAEWNDQTQILTILLTGRSPDEMSEQEGNAAGALAGLLLNSVIGGARIGSVSIDADGSIRVVLPPVAPNVFAESVLSPSADLDENRFTFEVEWAALRRLVVDATYGDVVKTADVFWEFRF